MSDFMRNVVSEVLQRNHAIPFSGVTPAHPEDYSKPQPPVKRTNYQKEQAAKRLALIAGAAASSSSSSNLSNNSGNSSSLGNSIGSGSNTLSTHSGGTISSTSGALHTQHFVEHCLSPLLLRTLSHKNVEVSSPGNSHIKAQLHTPETSEPFRLSTARDMDAWLFPDISTALRPLLGITSRNYSAAGVISTRSCHPGQLFAAEKILADDPTLEAEIYWGEADPRFELKLFSNHFHKVAIKLKEIVDLLQVASTRRVQLFVSLSPTPLLRQHLGAGQQESIAVVDAASRWNSIGLVQQLLYRCPHPELKIRAEHSYVTITGTSAQITAVEAELKTMMRED
ncbi:hypothetical protein H1230_05680 [Paenibacillus sp. 19GGS1-52]|uniref:hypothetical protein n=1 Tax=Paenibacillus sp. 19GGS1-52 TaxID=2758563 RepID=UPI001EFA8512|nr:hypothetical protein [Paenibacillus sp. 19GGS1-52]ULO08306.1 hypothetical protein H1230_05680 [Paenibacillus sp. 19GGS1-52]